MAPTARGNDAFFEPFRTEPELEWPGPGAEPGRTGADPLLEAADGGGDHLSYLGLKNIFADGELIKGAVTEKLSATASDGKISDAVL